MRDCVAPTTGTHHLADFYHTVLENQK